jgi:hypothetical protein
MSASVRTAIVLVALAAASSATAKAEYMIALDIIDAPSEILFQSMSGVLEDAPIIGTPPKCRVTIQSVPIPLDELMTKLNRTFGIEFVETAEGFQILVPEDTHRLCTAVFLGV